MAKGFFITGTDTNIGKTVASCAVLHHLSQQGFTVAGMKPVASGAVLNAGRLENGDALSLIRHSNIALEYAQVNPYCFAPAIAPHLAAAQVNVDIDLVRIQRTYEALSKLSDWVIVEGVGGWLVPINARQSIADLAVQLKLPVILVVGMRLGCINHALLSMESIRSRNVNFKGWIANQIEPEMSAYGHTLKTLQNKMNSTYLGSIPYFNKGQFDLNQSSEIKLSL